jgi:iron complex outermembrane recepter protein
MMGATEDRYVKGARKGRARFVATIAGALSATALASTLGITPARAQTANASIDDNVIIVTAQRRDQALEDVPMTVSVITQDTFAAAGVTSLRDIQNVTTGFQLGQGGGFPQPAIRGVTTVLSGTFENNVAVYVDGFYQVAPQSLAIDLPNVESVQVLKGPQGTLYGRNATGGAILLNTIAPSDTWEGRAEITYARFDDKRAGGYIAGPLAENIGISVSGYIRRSDGYIKLASRTVPGETDGNAAPLEQDSIRVKLQADLSEDFRATLGYNFVRTNDPRGLLFSSIENVAPALAASPTRPTELGVAAWDYGTELDTRQHEFTLALQLDTQLGTLRSWTGYSIFKPHTEFDFDGSYLQTSWSTSTFDQRTFQQTVDFAIDAIENVDVVVGGTYFNDSTEALGENASAAYAITQSNPAVPPPLSNVRQNLQRNIEQSKEAWALYADVTFQATDRLSLNVGGRYSEEKQENSTSWVNPITGAIALPFTATDAKFSKFTPRASIRYELAPRTNIYASYSQGFRSGAFPTFPPGNNAANWFPADQEVVDAYEVGFKTAGPRYRFEVAGFYYDYQSLQVSTTQTVGNPPLPLVVVTNVPSAEIYGVEGSVEFEIVDNLTIRGGATWLHARFGDGAFVDGTAVNPNLPGINTNSDPLKTYRNVSQTQNLSGLQLARAPDFTAFLGIDYLIPMGDGGLRFGANVRYTDSYVVTNPSIWCDPTAANGAICAGIPADRQREQRFREGAFALINASVTWTDPTDHYFVRVWGNNLTDHKYRLHYTGNGTWGSYSPLAEPLTYGATVGYKF